MAKVPSFGKLIEATRATAVHLEMRDAYTRNDQVPGLAGGEAGPGTRASGLV